MLETLLKAQHVLLRLGEHREHRPPDPHVERLVLHEGNAVSLGLEADEGATRAVSVLEVEAPIDEPIYNIWCNLYDIYN